MGDLVDLLREKLEHADDVVCTCPDVDISTQPGCRLTTKGWDRDCPIDGANGTKPSRREVDPSTGEVRAYQNSGAALDTEDFRNVLAFFRMHAEGGEEPDEPEWDAEVERILRGRFRRWWRGWTVQR